jgi:pimeloyl-ACP methyl ester carboxylesterase
LTRAVFHFGGNGHCAWRLDAARRALAERPGAPVLIDVPYPGFERRPSASSRGAFLEALAEFCEEVGADAAYASGIGALVALGLRARGDLAGVPLILQGPVLWGLERRAFPRLMRLMPPARQLLPTLFRRRAFQARFARKQFCRPLDGPGRDAFFAGYRDCEAFGAFFEWFTPDWLRALERSFAARPEALGCVTVWRCGLDRVVGAEDVEATERALGVRWPAVVFPEWGHYPMIDEPEGWADALCDALAAA